MNGRLAGIALQLAAHLTFISMDTLVKLLTARFAVPQLMWARFLFGAMAVALVLRFVSGPLPWRSRVPGLQAIRSLTLAGSNLSFTTALVFIPLADATAVGFASPLLTVALAAVWLREKVGALRWIGVAVGMAGVLIVLRPPFLFGAAGGAFHWALLLPLVTAAFFAVYQILTRKLATVDDPRTTILHTSLAAVLLPSLLLPSTWIPPVPAEWGFLVLLGLLGGAGHGLLVLAYARAPASLLAPLSYSQMIWAMLAGVLVFGDWPDRVALVGMAVIAAGGIVVALPSGRR